jgi:hypothetical protein
VLVGGGVGRGGANKQVLNEEDLSRLDNAFEYCTPDCESLGLSFHLALPYDLPHMHMSQMRRQERLAKLSREEIYTVPSPLLYSLEGYGYEQYQCA